MQNYSPTPMDFSLNELRFFQAGLKHKGQWKTKREWAEASGINSWSVPRLLSRFLSMDLLKRETISPFVFYCFTDKAAKEAENIQSTYARQIEILKSREDEKITKD